MKGYEVEVEGEYIARSGVMGAERIIKKYKVKLKLPSMNCAMSVIKNKLLKPALSVAYDDFIAPRTQNITEITPLDQESAGAMKKVPVQYMNRETLLAYIDSEELPVDADLYPNLYKLREAVESAMINPEEFAKKQEERRESLIEDQTLAEMNPGLFAKDEKDVQTKPKLAPLAVAARLAEQKALDKKSHEKQVEDRLEGLKNDIDKTAIADRDASEV